MSKRQPIDALKLHEMSCEALLSAVSEATLAQVIAEACPDEISLRRLLSQTSILRDDLRLFLAQRLKSFLENYRENHVSVVPSALYASGYSRADSIERQIEILRKYEKFFLDVRPRFNWKLSRTQNGLLQSNIGNSEGYFVVVLHESMIESRCHGTDPFMSILAALGTSRLDSEVHALFGDVYEISNRVRSDESIVMLRLLWEAQGRPDNLLLIPAQLGSLYSGWTALSANEDMRKHRRIPLGIWETIQMILTHPSRLATQNDLQLVCSGETVGPDEVNSLRQHAISIGMVRDSLIVSHHPVDAPNGKHGVVSGYMP